MVYCYDDTMHTILTLAPYNNAHSHFKKLTPLERRNLVMKTNITIFNHELLDDLINHIRKSD